MSKDKIKSDIKDDKNKIENSALQTDAPADTGETTVTGDAHKEAAAKEDFEKLYYELKEKLDKKEAEAAEYLDMLRRTQAEMDNFRKRMMKEQEQITQFASQVVLLELLPVIDNLERALNTADTEIDGGKLREGVELIYSQLKGILEKECVEVIDPVGEEFDPLLHEAVMQVEADGRKENTVVEVMQKGYSLKGRLLRPAMVTVAK